MQLIIRSNKPLNHAQGFVLSVLIYIWNIFENGPRRVQANARNWNRELDTQIEANQHHSKIQNLLSSWLSTCWNRRWGHFSTNHKFPCQFKWEKWKYKSLNLSLSKLPKIPVAYFLLSFAFSSCSSTAIVEHYSSLHFFSNFTLKLQVKVNWSPREPLLHLATSNFR